MTSRFAEKVQEQVTRLQNSSLSQIEREVAEKRIAWFQQPGHAIYQGKSFSHRQAFEALFFEYMNLSPADLPVISESETEIRWLSKNPCPTLAACQQLQLDTLIINL